MKVFLIILKQLLRNNQLISVFYQLHENIIKNVYTLDNSAIIYYFRNLSINIFEEMSTFLSLYILNL